MTNQIESLGSSFYNFGETADSSAQDSKEVDFLELMLTQMQNQDPLNPMESGEFLSQLAQFETASGIGGLQESIDRMSSSFQSSQALEVSTLVGRDVLVGGNIAPIEDGGTFKGAIDVPSGTNNLTVSIFTPAGELVDKLNFQNPAAGVFDYSWDGKDTEGNTVNEGTYVVEAIANYNGQNVALNTYLESRVDSVSLNALSGNSLNLANNKSVAIDDIYQVR